MMEEKIKVFNEPYHKFANLTLKQAISNMSSYMLLKRKKWNDKVLLVRKAKKINTTAGLDANIHIVDNYKVSAWCPTSGDLLAKDYEIIDP